MRQNKRPMRKRKEFILKFIFILFIIGALNDVTIYYFKGSASGSLALISIIRVIFVVIFIIYYFYTNKKIIINTPGKLILLFLVYTFLLSIASSDVKISLWNYSKVLLSMIFFIISFNLIKNPHDLKIINNMLSNYIFEIKGMQELL